MEKVMNRKAQESDYGLRQLSLDKLLKKSPNTRVQYPVDPEDIGGQLLPMVSQGLYTNPLHCLREYAQNGVDAGANQIKIKFTANSLLVHDDGTGMDAQDLLEARQFGVSRKDLRNSVGFRGVGIFSGFNICNRLLITTKKRGEAYRYVLELDFGAMKQRLSADRQAGLRQPALADLIESYSSFAAEPDDEEQSHYTTVMLEDISDYHMAQFADRIKLRDYILRNLPIEFEHDFVHRAEIRERLDREVPGFNAVTVVLETDGGARETIAKPAIPELDSPEFQRLTRKTADGGEELVGLVWSCLRKTETGKRGKIGDIYREFRGFVYKIKGFTIGDNTKLRHIFTRGNATLYEWYTGEVYVIDANVVPNAERNDFEAGPAKDALEQQVILALKRLESTASQYQIEERALDVCQKYEQDIVEAEETVNSTVYDVLKVWEKLTEAIERLEEHAGKLPPDQRAWGKDLLDRAKSLSAKVSSKIGTPQPVTQQRKEAVKRRGDKRRGTSTAASFAETGADKSTTVPPLTVQPPLIDRTLMQVIEEAGWSLASDSRPIVDIIDRAIADVLISGSDQYRALLSDIANKLAEELVR